MPCRMLFSRQDLAASLFFTVAFCAALPTGAASPTVPVSSHAPLQKNLKPSWIKALFERGSPSTYTGGDLTYIGMPVGGVCAGQVYLGGDGKLWLWDIFNRYTHGLCNMGSSGRTYVNPLKPVSPFDQGFALIVHTPEGTQVRTLDKNGFSDITFLGQYPVGEVTYRDPDCPVTVHLTAFSPFIPLNLEDSSLPAVCLVWRLTNHSPITLTCGLVGWLQNPVCLYSAARRPVDHRNYVARRHDMTFVFFEAVAPTAKKPPVLRPDIVFEDFESPTYGGWTTTGTAFGDGPIEQAAMPRYQGNVGCHGKRLVNSHNTRNGEDVRAGDAHIGTLTSPPFTIRRRYIRFLVGGGAHSGKTCVNLVVDGKVVRTVTGKNDNRMSLAWFDVRAYEGKRAKLVVVDNHRGSWGNIGIDYIVFTDKGPDQVLPLQEESDFGSMAFALLDPLPSDTARARADLPIKKLPERTEPVEAVAPSGVKLCGEVTRRWTLRPGEERTAVFVIAWYFPNLKLPPFKQKKLGRWYATKFSSAQAVVSYISRNWRRLSRTTMLWRDTWYGGTLPCWFLERTFANTSTLATSTVYRFENGRFYGWEGVGCCAGTCTHVWHYAQAVARLFPELERDLRERVDFGLAFDPSSGMIRFRGEFSRGPAVDGQAGCVLRAYREHLMSPDRSFLKRLWPRIKKAVLYLIKTWDPNGDGILEGAQHNTLDAAWYGKIPHLSSMYLAALRAAEEMAEEIGDIPFADRCRGIRVPGAERFVRELFNGEYFVQILDPKHADAPGVGSGCHIDQVLGQSWAFQVGLGRILPAREVRSALASLWKYNFTPDVGLYKPVFMPGRPFALPGEAGLLMCTWPKGGLRPAWAKHWQFKYFNECMTGFEYQVAAHMIREGMVKEGLAICRAVHERYHPSKRNPYNEIECGDHYARAMASYGVFIAACGFRCNGPRGFLAFAPRIRPENFKAAFTAAEGWGTISQERLPDRQRNRIEVKWGCLRLRELAFEVPEGRTIKGVSVAAAAVPVEASFDQEGNKVSVKLKNEVILKAGEALTVLLR